MRFERLAHLCRQRLRGLKAEAPGQQAFDVKNLRQGLTAAVLNKDEARCGGFGIAKLANELPTQAARAAIRQRALQGIRHRDSQVENAAVPGGGGGGQGRAFGAKSAAVGAVFHVGAGVDGSPGIILHDHGGTHMEPRKRGISFCSRFLRAGEQPGHEGVVDLNFTCRQLGAGHHQCAMRGRRDDVWDGQSGQRKLHHAPIVACEGPPARCGPISQLRRAGATDKTWRNEAACVAHSAGDVAFGGCCLDADSCTETDPRLRDAAAVDLGVDVSAQEVGAGDAAGDVGAEADSLDTQAADVRPRCLNSNACSADKPLCVDGDCVACTAPNTMGVTCASRESGAAPVCAPDGRCVGCVMHTDCKEPAKPICGAGNQCNGCVEDGECAARDVQGGGGPGLCVWGGLCAKEAEITYVNASGACAVAPGGNAGSKANPYCAPLLAINALGGHSTGYVLLEGTKALQRVVADPGAGKTLNIIARGSGTTAAPAIKTDFETSVAVLSGTVRLRGLRVVDGDLEGIRVQGAQTVAHIDRCFVQGNKGGGIIVTDAGFVISNTLVTGNGPGTAPGGGNWGGILINNPATPARLFHVTVAGNANSGIACSKMGAGNVLSDAKGVAIFNNGAPQVSPVCDVANCCPSAPAPFDSSYRFRSDATMCLDQIDLDPLLLVDAFGTKRSGKGDCGGAELVK